MVIFRSLLGLTLGLALFASVGFVAVQGELEGALAEEVFAHAG